MTLPLSRRQFLKNSAVLGAGLAASAVPGSLRAGDSPNERFVIAIMGMKRGMALANGAMSLPNVEIRWVCDVDSQRLAQAVERVKEGQGKAPKGATDFREILDDPEVDAIFIATCNHWQAPATILACAAGKHVYVEKPGSHNPWEAEMMVAAARKHKRVVQVGNQRRSWPGIIEGIERLHGGAIGEVHSARTWYNSGRGSIGKGGAAAVPGHIDYALWQGPAPDRPYKDNLIHYNWHWHWHWGNGELGNNGIHALDLARWGLRVDLPKKITYNGGRYHYDDDWEFPDTGVATFDFGGKGISWDCSSCHRRRAERTGFVTFYGENGTLALTNNGYRLYDPDGEETGRTDGPEGIAGHITDFLTAIRDGSKPNSDVEDAQTSTLLCHLGNIAYKTGETIHFDPDARKIIGSEAGTALWKREYRPGWEPTV